MEEKSILARYEMHPNLSLLGNTEGGNWYGGMEEKSILARYEMHPHFSCVIPLQNLNFIN